MKKTLLSLLCAMCLSAASAGEITDVFTADNMPGMPTAASAAATSVTSGNGVKYTFANCNRNNSNNVFLFSADGATFSAELKSDCSRIVFNGNSNQGVGRIALSVAGIQIQEVDAVDRNFTFDIPEAYQAAGTVYTFTRVNGNNRLLSIVYTTIDRQTEQWAAPVFNIPDNSYVLAGQKIEVTNVGDGATLDLSYRIGKSGELTKVEGNSFEIPANTNNLSSIFITATVSGAGKDASTAELTVRFTNGKRPVVDSFALNGCDVTGSSVTFDYSIGIVNQGINKSSVITVTVNVINENGETVATASNDTNNQADEPATQAEGIEPVLPVIVSKSIVVNDLEIGNYTFAMTWQVGESAPEEVNLGDRNAFTVNSTATAIDIVDVDKSNSEAIYYTVYGQPVANPQPGQLLVKVQGGKAVKTIIR